MHSWRYILHGPASPARNMAIDEALLRELPVTGQPILRLYEWDCPAVSLGYFQEVGLAPENRPWIRRYTGGGLVDHAADVTYTIVAPRGHAWLDLPVPESYAIIHRGVQAALRAIGVSSALAPQASEADSPACFQKPVRFDLVAASESGDGNLAPGALKLGGAAQRRTKEGMLHQGSILPPQEDQRSRLLATFAVSFAACLELGPLLPSDLTPSEIIRADALEQDRYSTAEWNRQRDAGPDK